MFRFGPLLIFPARQQLSTRDKLISERPERWSNDQEGGWSQSQIECGSEQTRKRNIPSLGLPALVPHPHFPPQQGCSASELVAWSPLSLQHLVQRWPTHICLSRTQGCQEPESGAGPRLRALYTLHGRICAESNLGVHPFMNPWQEP